MVRGATGRQAKQAASAAKRELGDNLEAFLASLNPSIGGAPLHGYHNQPPLNPARRSPVWMYGQPRIKRHGRPVRWFSIINTIGP